MKVSTSDLSALRAAIAPLDTLEVRARYAAGDFPRSEAVRDLDRRYRFDLFYAARAYSVVEGSYSDAHFDTALRAIVPPITR